MRNAYREVPIHIRTLHIDPGTAILIGSGISAGFGLLSKNASKGGQTQSLQAINDAKIQSDQLIAAANVEAAGLIAAGNEAAAAATIEAAKIASNALLQATNASIAVQREFAQRANRVLQPTIKQGRFAQNEIASMLAIPNSKGSLVPFDVSKLTDLPSFQTGIRGIENTAVGKKLSTQQAERAALFGADFFGQRVGQLHDFAQFGANAENTLASGLFGTGANLGQTNINLGQGLANVAQNQGNSLANIFTQGANQQAQLGLNTANALSNNFLGLGQAQAQTAANRGAIDANFFNQLGSLGNLLPLLALGGTPASSGTAILPNSSFRFPGRNP